MKVILIKPYLMGQILKPVGRHLDVTREFGNQLIADGYAESVFPKTKAKKTKLNTTKNGNDSR